MDQDKLQQEILKKRILWKVMTKEALERLNRVKVAHPELATSAEALILQYALSGKINKVDDTLLKQILESLSSRKKGFRILRR